jgi:histidinol-phosphate/aromatic aminotransferase/cobyric acid decarboxylase-like protein
VERIMQTARIEVGGVEYIIDDRDGQLYFYDINALSNFVSDGPKVVGFNPFTRLAEYLEQEAASVAAHLRDQGVSVRPLGAWGAPTCIRVSIGTPEQNGIFLDAARKIARTLHRTTRS